MVWTEGQHEAQPRSKEQDGSLIFFIKSGFKAIEISKGMTGIHVPRIDQLPGVIETVIQAMRAGEPDAQLKAAAEASPIMKAKSKK